MPQLPDPITKNYFPDCVSLKLHFESDDEAKKGILSNVFTSSDKEQNYIILSLTIVLNKEQEIEIHMPQVVKALGMKDGKAKFGIREGKLSIAFSNCKILLETIELGQPFKIYIDVEETQEKSAESSITAKIPKPTLSVDRKQINKESLKSQERRFQISNSGSEALHSWKFEVKDNAPCLVGTLKKKALGKIEYDADFFSIKACFTAQEEGVRLTGGQIGLTKNISRNRLALIERAIALRYIAPRLLPSMSMVKWNG